MNRFSAVLASALLMLLMSGQALAGQLTVTTHTTRRRASPSTPT
jgi:hypothetical protein